MNTSITNPTGYLQSHQTGGKDWPTDAVFAAVYRQSTWPCGWEKEANVSFFASKEKLDIWLANKAEWALSEDNEWAARVYEWDLGPFVRSDLSHNAGNSGLTFEEREQLAAARVPKKVVVRRLAAAPVENATFHRIFGCVPKVQFHAQWTDCSGHYSNAICSSYAPRLSEGEAVASEDAFGRKILIIGVGKAGAQENMVVREHGHGEGDHGMLVCDASRTFAARFKNMRNMCLNHPVNEWVMVSLGEFIAQGMVRTRTDWADRARVLAPWLAV